MKPTLRAVERGITEALTNTAASCVVSDFLPTPQPNEGAE